MLNQSIGCYEVPQQTRSKFVPLKESHNAIQYQLILKHNCKQATIALAMSKAQSVMNEAVLKM